MSARTFTSYQLEIEVARAVRITVGRLGTFDFPAGRYVYTGSARRNLEARIARHCAHDKRLRWHIDYLLASPEARLVGIRRSTRAECELARATRGCIIAPGFGSSDCREGCSSHLGYFDR